MLGIGRASATSSFVLADIPGLIEGAHEGAGLGVRFLGHVERCAALIHLVDGTQDDVVGAWRTVRHELEAYGHGLATSPRSSCLSKVDALDDARRWQPRRPSSAAGAPAADVCAISARRPARASSRVLRSGLALVRAQGSAAASGAAADGRDGWAP